MSRAERRRQERLQKKEGQGSTITREMIHAAVWKNQLTQDIDRELGNRYYQQASKEACDNIYYIMLCSEAMALHDCCRTWGSEAIGKRLQVTMDYIDRFPATYQGNIAAYIRDVEAATGLQITVDSIPGGETHGIN